MEDVIGKVVEKNLIDDDQPSLDVFDLDYFDKRVESLFKAFPEDFFTHALSIKANPFRCLLKQVLKHGMGAECASFQEAIHAKKLGFSPAKIVYDSPVKTRKEMFEAIKLGFYMNLDNELEIQQGLRINPVVGAGADLMVSTATKQSKFGLPLLEDTREKIIKYFEDNKWLTALHIHVGSQGIPLDMFVKGQVKTIDIGGGLSTSYTESQEKGFYILRQKMTEPEAFTYQTYRDKLQEKIPELFSGKYEIVTEFGRSLLLKAGTSLTKIQSVKNWVLGQKPILMTHLGTNQFPIEVYCPQVRKHRFSIYSAEGKKKEGEEIMVDIGGPLCFQGDYLAKEVELSNPEPGDILVVHDTGAYTMSMYCRYNSILAGGMYGYRRQDGIVELECFKKRETIEECMAFWGQEQSQLV